jgi:hypothetical protein
LNANNLVGCCGNYCGSCEIHRAYKDKGKLLVDTARKHNCLPADVRCEGCQALAISGWSRSEGWGRDCEIRKCLSNRGISFCFDCNEITACDRWNELAASCLAAGMDLEASLQALKDGSIAEWLARQDARWRCQKCAQPTCATEASVCHRCGEFQL